MNTQQNILIVDDFGSQRSITLMAVKNLNLNAHFLEAQNGQEAIDIMMTQNVVGVITDYEMPVMDGLEMVKRMRQSPRLRSIPVIMITSIDDTRTKAMAAGTNAWIHKPYNQADLNNAIMKAFPPSLHGKSYKVLLVDDVQMQTSIWEKLLVMPSFSFVKTSSAREAWRAIKQHKFDAIITDYLMPDVDGLRLIKKIKLTPQTSKIPVLVITQDTSVEKEALAQGAKYVFPKPFNPAMVKKALKELLLD